MPDIILLSLIIFLFVAIFCWAASNDNIYGLLFLAIPISFMIWLGYAASLPWDFQNYSCNVSDVILPNGGKTSSVSYQYEGQIVTKILPYYLDSSKYYLVQIPVYNKTYGGIYFVSGPGNSEKLLNIKKISPESAREVVNK